MAEKDSGLSDCEIEIWADESIQNDWDTTQYVYKYRLACVQQHVEQFRTSGLLDDRMTFLGPGMDCFCMCECRSVGARDTSPIVHGHRTVQMATITQGHLDSMNWRSGNQTANLAVIKLSNS